MPGAVVDILEPRKQLTLVTPNERIPVRFGLWKGEKNEDLVSLQDVRTASASGSMSG